MTKPKIIIRADGGTSIGMGHVIRCLALADMLKNDFIIYFAIQQPAESVLQFILPVTPNILHLPVTNDYHQDAINFLPYINSNDIVILDGYHFKTSYQQAIKNKECKLVAIDDLHAWHHVADVIINHAAGVDRKDYSIEKYSKLYLGLDYALLRKPFLTASTETKKINTIKKVFVSMGAADISNLTQKFTEALIHISGIEEIHLMLGSINPHISNINGIIEKNKQIKIIKHFDISAENLSELLNNIDLAICPASSISLESCAVGVGLISGYSAENQKGILQGLIDSHSIINWGNLNLIKPEFIVSELKDLNERPDKLNSLIENQKKLIDGKSPERIKELFKDLIPKKIHFRFANESDLDLYFNWVNDESVRKNSFNQALIPYEDHVKWFMSRVNDKNFSFYLFFNENDQPIGQVRIEKNKDENIVDISIDENFRGKSIGSSILHIACKEYLNKNPSESINSYIKRENIASYKIFQKADFVEDTQWDHKGSPFYKLILKNN